jgi:predicted nucleotidyltransferase component of viral defense system
MQLKDRIKNKSKQTDVHANTLLQNYMMERFLERVSLSKYRENIILKGGFLIASMVGVDKRSTMDLDTTVKNLPFNREEIERIMLQIITIDADDGVTFEIQDICNIRDISQYDDFRVSLIATFHTVRVNMKIDITTGDSIIPHEIEYHYKLMFEERAIPVMAYNIYTILAEKIETILTRGVGNTRGRDFYDAYLLLSLNNETLLRSQLILATKVKAEERGTTPAFESRNKILHDITNNPEIAKIWENYEMQFSYANGISLSEICSLITWVFEG